MPSIKTILVIGSSGQLGQSLKTLESQYSHYLFTFITRDNLDLSDANSIAKYFTQNEYDLIINCAAYTAVDKAEIDQELADAINHLAVKQLADIALRTNTTLIHISTDYVFDGTSHTPYIETDTVNPQSVYGASKLKGEQAIQNIAPHAIIIRTSWVYSEYGNNFVKTMLKLGQERDQLNVIFDQIGSPTYAKDLAHTLIKIVDHRNTQQKPQHANNVSLYHYSNEGTCSWYDFSKAIFELNNIACDVSPIMTKDYPTPAKRPHYSLLNKSKIKQDIAITIPYWKNSLQSCLQNLQDSHSL